MNTVRQTVSLTVVDGFALLLNEIWPSLQGTTYTDIDYLGDKLAENIERIVQAVGIEFGLGKKWINNEIPLYGASVEDLELRLSPECSI